MTYGSCARGVWAERGDEPSKGGRMARPVNANAEQTRQRILDAGARLFAQGGFEGVSVRQIARGANVSLGMIRHYFGSKDGLYRACIASAFEIYGQVGQQIRQGVGAGSSPAEVMADSVRAGFRLAYANRAACRLMLWDMMQRDSVRNELDATQMVPFVLETAHALAAPLGRPVADLAMVTRTLIFLVVRYATADHDEIATLLAVEGGGGKADEQTLQAIEEHLAAVAAKLYA